MKYALPLLIVMLAAVLIYDFSSVERIDFAPGAQMSRATTSRDDVVSKRALSGDVEELKAGQSFASLEELVENQRAEGFLRTGYFGKHWPATVMEIATDRHKISFVRQDGTKHNYTGFHGYDMKMVRLRAGNKETIVVFRSQDKR